MPRTQSQPNPGTVQDSATEPRARQKGGRILAADDQPHILEAIELLLRPEGFQVDTAKSPAAVREALRQRFLRCRADRPELHPRHNFRAGRTGPALRDRRLRQQHPGHRDDRVGQRWTGGRGHAPRRARLHPEAVGERTPVWPSCAPRSNCIERCSGPSTWKRKPNCCAPKDVPSSSPPRPPCSRCCRR